MLMGLTGPGVMGLLLVTFIVVIGGLVSVSEIKIKRWWKINSDYDSWDRGEELLERHESSVSEDEYDAVMKKFSDAIEYQVDNEFYLSDEEMQKLIDEGNKAREEAEKEDDEGLEVLTDEEIESLFNDNDSDGK